MPEYTLRNVDPKLWSQFIERANREGWPTRALIVSLLEAYARGDVTPAAPAPRELPEYAWLRAYYRDIAKRPEFEGLDQEAKWELLVGEVVNSPAGLSWQTLEAIPLEKRLDILRWLDLTSNVPISHVLTLRAIAHIGEGPDLRTNRRAFQYEVLGLPPGHQAWIADYNGGWRVLRAVNGEHQGDWSNPHVTKEEALSVLAEMIQSKEQGY